MMEIDAIHAEIVELAKRHNLVPGYLHDNLDPDYCACRHIVAKPSVVGMDGPTCVHCGGMTRRTGTCALCVDCGETTGCG